MKRINSLIAKNMKKTKKKRFSKINELQHLIPKFRNVALFSNSPILSGINALNNKLASNRRMIDNLRKHRRSMESGNKKSKSKGVEANALMNFNKKFAIKLDNKAGRNRMSRAKSPITIINPPVIDCKLPPGWKDSSITLNLQIKLSEE